MNNNTIEEFNMALMQNDENNIKKMLEDGFNPNTINEYGNHMLYIATEYSNDKICKLLVECGANVNQKNIYGNTALISAATNGREKLLDYYISKGADVSAVNNKGVDAAHLASVYCQDEIAKKLEKYKVEEAGFEA